MVNKKLATIFDGGFKNAENEKLNMQLFHIFQLIDLQYSSKMLLSLKW